MRIVILTTLLLLCPTISAYATFEPPKYQIRLVLADAALDKDGNYYVIVNSWTSRIRNLRRILPDHTLDTDFRLARIDECCTIDPFLVDTDGEGNIYIVKYRVPEDDFIVVKYTPDGEIFKDFAADGVLEYPFKNPVDLDVRPDGFVYVLDKDAQEVYVIAPDGSEVREQVYRYYSLIKPSKLELGPNGEMYIFDVFDTEFSRYEIGQGIVKCNPDGTPVDNYGIDWESINSGFDPLDYQTFVVDVDGSLWVLGAYSPDAGPWSGAYHFAPDGSRIDSVSLDYQLGAGEDLSGITAANENGFILYEINDISLGILRYSPQGKVVEKFSLQIFKTEI